MKGNICGKHEGEFYQVKERQLNKGEHFAYYYCKECGTLQLAQNVDNIGVYYANDYYSFEGMRRRKSTKLKRMFRKIFIMYISHCNILTNMRTLLWKKYAPYMFLEKTNLKTNASILDVGCGSGNWLYLLHECGFIHLNGIDLFCEKSPYGDIFNYKKTDIFDSTLSKYDLVTFHHSFEHMQEPKKILARVKEMLTDKGVCIIRVPVNECEAWKRYKENWYQIDAPRHFYLYTERALKLLVEDVGMYIERIVYDSQPTQFSYSEWYKNTDLSLGDIAKKITGSETERYIELTERVNMNREGDQAIFYIKVR